MNWLISRSTRSVGWYSKFIFTFLLSVATISPKCARAQSCAAVTGGIISSWSAEGGASDQYGIGNGTLKNGAGFSAGKVGQAFSFDGLNDYVEVPHNANWNFGAANFTIELWVKFNQVRAAQALVAHDIGPGTVNKWILWLNNGILQMHTYDTSLAKSFFFGGGTFNPATNQWYHIAITRNSSIFTIYVNGVTNSQITSTSTIPDASAVLTIGQAEGLYFLNGLEDEVAIYNRALSGSEIASIYSAGSAGKCFNSAPNIASQPQSIGVLIGQQAAFSISASGASPLKYQWKRDGADVPGGTNSSLTIQSAQPGDEGSYQVAVTNLYGFAISSNATLVVTNFTCAPVFAGLKSWWTAEGNGGDQYSNANVTLRNGAGFAPGEVGQAFVFNGSNQYADAPNNANWNFGTNNFSIELWANFSSVKSSQVLLAHDEGQGTLNKWIFWLNNGVLQMHVYSSTTGSLFLGSGSFNPITNKWYHLAITRNGSQYSIYINGALSSTATSSARIPDAAALLTFGQAESLFFLNGKEDEISIYNRALDAAEIQQICAAGAAGKCQQSPPIIITQPSGQTVNIGNTYTLSVAASGALPLYYQWQKNSADLAYATNSTITLTNIQLTDAGNYRVVVTNAYGAATSSIAALVVSDTPCTPVASGLISWWGGDFSAADLQSTNHGVLKNGASFAAGKVGGAFSFNGANQYVEVPNSSRWDFGVGEFTIELWVKFNRTTGTQALVAHDQGAGTLNKWIFWLNNGVLQMHVYSAATQSLFLGSGSFNAETNQWYHLAITRSGSAFVLYVNGAINSVATTAAAIPAASAPLTIGQAENIYYLNGQEDEVSIYNRALTPGEIQGIYNAGSYGKCQPGTAPIVLTQPGSQTLATGSPIVLSVGAFGTSPLAFQWRLAGTNLPGATNYDLNLGPAEVLDNGNYDVVVTNVFGSVTSAVASILVLTPPQITTQPHDQTVAISDDASFAVEATGSDPLFFQWFRNGTAIAGATNPTLVLTNLQPAEAGSYSVMVSNAIGVAQSISAGLSLSGSNSCVAPAAGLVSWWRGEGDAGDYTGGNDGALLGGVSFPAGKVGLAFGLNGTNQFVEIPYNPNLNPTGSFTMAGWIYPVPQLAARVVMGKWSTSGDYSQKRSYLLRLTSGNALEFLISDLTHQSDGSFQSFSTTNFAVPSYAWTHVAAVYNYVTGIRQLYINGEKVAEKTNTQPISILSAATKFTIGARLDTSVTAAEFFEGMIDEPSIYSRDLAAGEIEAIFTADAIGQCTIPVPPSITGQPVSLTAGAGTTAALSVIASGTGPLGYQWNHEGTNLNGAVNSTLSFSSLQYTNGGSYYVVVSSPYGSVTSSVAAVTVATPPSKVFVSSQTVTSGIVVVPINLAAQGAEHAVGFSLNFSGTYLTFAGIELGGAATGGQLIYNTNGLPQNHLGIAVALAGSDLFPAGTQEVALVSFFVKPTTGTVASTISFGDSPVLRQVSDPQAHALTSTFHSGVITITVLDLDGDVTPRTTGDRVVSVTDWVQVGRFVAGLDVATNGVEFQRADCAPRSTLGNGHLTVADWVQAGRYAVGLDNPTLLGGPSTNLDMVPFSLPRIAKAGAVLQFSSGRVIRMSNAAGQAGQPIEAHVQLDSLGNENGIGFTATFDPAKLSFVGAALGTNATGANLNVNSMGAANGKIGVVMSLAFGTSFSPEMGLDLLKLNFTAQANALGTAVLGFAGQPVGQEIVDPSASTLSTDYVTGTVSIIPAAIVGSPTLNVTSAPGTVTLSWPWGAYGYQLESSDTLNGGTWTTVSTTASTNGTDMNLTLPTAGTQKFYRLHHP